AGAIDPDAGETVYAGSPLVLGTTSAAQAAGIATAYQELSLVPDWDVATSLLDRHDPSTRAGRVNPRKARRLALDAMHRFGVPRIDPSRRVRELSLAERQMLEIVHALMAQPRILVLDEPTSALTPDQVWWFFDLVREFVSAEKIVLFISHRLEEILTL